MSYSRGFNYNSLPSGPPPKRTGPETQMAQMGYGLPGGPGGGRSSAYSTSLGKKRLRDDDDYYFDTDESGRDLEYQPAPDSPTYQKAPESESDDSDDPLEAFMEGIEKQVKKQDVLDKIAKKKGPKAKGVRDDIEAEDVQEEYYRYMEENPNAGLIGEEDDLVEYDDDGNPIIVGKKVIDPLPPIDHHEIDYDKFDKNFYEEHEEIRTLTVDQVEDLRNKLGIRVTGIDPPKPVSSFGHFGFEDKLVEAIIKAKYSQPTPIQAQGIPVALSGRDIIGIAKTGSGKTAAYIWPLLVHIMAQKELKPGDGPIGLICAPTRELSQQIYHEAKKFGKIYNIHVVCAYGGGSMYEQCKACEEGAELIVATPGRLIDLVKKKATNLQRVTYLVFDEADRMFDMGFEPQVRSIANHVRPNRQTLMFSATFKKRVERVARDILCDPIRCIQGDLGEANEDVTQIIHVFQQAPMKWTWLLSNLVRFTTEGSVLIFVTRKDNSAELATNLKANDFKLALIHGDMSQMERNDVINSFKKQEVPILVATDVAARGLDIPHIKNVINFDVARDIDTHTHRIGRTGRAGTKGTAFSLLTPKDREFAPGLVRNLEGANQRVPEDVMELANQNPWFNKSRYKKEQARKLNVGGAGLGYKARPGLGSGGSGDSGSGYRSLDSVTGPQANRATVMKQAFSSQFKSCFVAATDEDSKWRKDVKYGIHEPVRGGAGGEGDGSQSESSRTSKDEGRSRRKKSRWD